MSLPIVALVTMTAAAGVAANIDLRSRRIPNAIVAALAIAALVFHAFSGWFSVLDALSAMLVVFLVGSLAFARGMIGGGDVKLITACVGVVGSNQALPLLAAIFLCGGVLSVVEAVRRRRLRSLVMSTAGAAVGLAPASGVRVPYGVAIAAGALVYSVSFLIVAH